jgi:hypothetical protein
MRGKKILQMSVLSAIASILVFPASSFVAGQVLPATDLDVSITEPLDGVILNITDVVINGTASGADLDSIEVLIDNTSQGNATLTDSSWTISVILAEGQRNVTAVARGTANSTASHSINLTIDLTNPSVEITSPEDLALFNTGTIIMNGTASDANGIQVVEVSIDDGPFENATGTNEWSFEFSLSDGDHSITVKATDNAGNSNATGIQVTVETQNPQISITSPLNNAILNSSNITINGTASDANGIQVVEVSIDDGPFENATGTNEWSFSATIQDGTYNATARAIDTFGNSVEAMISFTIDTQAPAVTVNWPPNGQLINSANLTIIGTASSNSIESVTLSIDGSVPTLALLNSTSGEWSFEAVNLVDGEHQLNATAIDSAGNEATAISSFIVDTIDPAISITSPTDNSTLTLSGITIAGNASDLNGIDKVQVSVNGSEASTANFNSTSGEWIFQAILQNGNRTITAIAIDLSGNSATTGISVIVDADGSVIAISSPSNGSMINSANVTISGTASSGTPIESVLVSIDESSATSASFNSTSGIWIFGPVPLVDGKHTAKAIATDMANNTAIANTSFTIDTVAPTIEILSPADGSNITSNNVGISGTSSDANGIASVQLSVDDGPFQLVNGTTSWSFDAVLANGNHTIMAQATDNAGNSSTDSISFIVQVQSQSPQDPQNPSPNQPSSKSIFTCGSGQVIKGKLELVDMQATFNGCEIRGSLRLINTDASFINTNIRGNVKVFDGDVTMLGSQLRGNLHDNGGSIVMKNNVITGNVKICNAQTIDIEDNDWNGKLKFCDVEAQDVEREKENASAQSDDDNKGKVSGSSENSTGKGQGSGSSSGSNRGSNDTESEQQGNSGKGGGKGYSERESNGSEGKNGNSGKSEGKGNGKGKK